MNMEKKMELKKTLLPVSLIALGLFGVILLTPSQDLEAAAKPSTAICEQQAAALGFDLGGEALLVPDCNCTVYNCTGPGTTCPGYRPPGGQCDAVSCGRDGLPQEE